MRPVIETGYYYLIFEQGDHYVRLNWTDTVLYKNRVDQVIVERGDTLWGYDWCLPNHFVEGADCSGHSVHWMNGDEMLPPTTFTFQFQADEVASPWVNQEAFVEGVMIRLVEEML